MKVIYLGEHYGNGKVWQLFKDRRGKEYYFKGVRGLWLGSVYEMARGGRMSTRPVRYDDEKWELTDQDRIESEARRIVVADYRASRRNEALSKRPHKDVLLAIELLSPFYLTLELYEREQFMRYICNQCSKKGVK